MHVSSVTKKTREHKERLFDNIRECIPNYQHCFVVTVDNMRNNYLKDVRQELSDSRYVLLLSTLFTVLLAPFPFITVLSLLTRRIRKPFRKHLS
jgi:ribosomal protein L10